MSTPENLPQVFEDDSIDLTEFLRKIYHGKRLILRNIVFSSVLGITLAFLLPVTFTSKTVFIPQTSDGKMQSSSLSGLASLAGITFGNNNNAEIPPNLYPRILTSVPYRLDLLDKKISLPNNEQIKLREYLNSKQRVSILDIILKYTLGLPKIIQSKLINPVEQSISYQNDIYELTEEDKRLFEILNSKMELMYNPVEGFVSLEFNDQNRYIAAQVVKNASLLLQSKIIAFKNQSALDELSFTKRQFTERKKIYEQLQDSLAVFKDQNLNISSSLYQNRLIRLQSELNIADAVVQQLAASVEQAKLQVNKDTPIFTIIEPVTISAQRSSPRRSMLVMVVIFISLMSSIGYLVIKDSIFSIFKTVVS